MRVVYVLLVAHFVADFIFQSDWMALNKSKRWDALAVHVAVYAMVLGLVTAVSCAVVLGMPLPPDHGFAKFYYINAGAHFVQDAITSRITSRLWFIRLGENDWGRDGWTHHAAFDIGNRHWFFVAIGADQLLHYVTLFVTAGWWLR